jgi:hypothetical protein
MSYDNSGNGDFVDCVDSLSETQDGLRVKSIEANGNLYITSSSGIKKISAKSTDDFKTTAGFITNSGGIKAADFSPTLQVTQGDTTSFFLGDSTIAYRIAWGTKDKNNNLVLGSPSQREVVYNPLLGMISNDFVTLLNTLDSLNSATPTTAMIRDANYLSTLKVTLSDSANTVLANMISLCTKLDNDIFLASQSSSQPLVISTATIASGLCTINFSTGNPSTYLSVGKKVNLAGFSPVTGTINGVQALTAVTSTSITFATTATGAVTLSTAQIHYAQYQSITQPTTPSIIATTQELTDIQTYLQNILTKLQNEPLTIISSTDAVLLSSIIITSSAKVKLTITIPEEVTSNYFFQVYRSSLTTSQGVFTLDSLTPDDELQLVYEAYPTSAELAAHSVTIVDDTPDEFRGANLYTNASTGEGILQANELPPFAKDINRFKGSIFYANTRTRHNMSPSLLGVVKMRTDFEAGNIPSITTSDSTNIFHTYDFVEGIKQQVAITCVADVSNSLNGKYFLLDTSTISLCVYFETTTATDPAISGRTSVKVGISTGDSASTVATKLANKLSTRLFDFNNVAISTATVTTTDINYVEVVASTAGNSGFSISNTLGRGEKIARNVTSITCPAASAFVSTATTADYFTLNSTGDYNSYYIWFKVGSSISPALANKQGIMITLTGAETNVQVAAAILTAIPSDFTVTALSNVLTITNIRYGKCTAATEVVASGSFILSTTVTGGINVLLSAEISPALATDQTARSLVRIINKNEDDIISAYYMSAATDVPGKLLFQDRSLTENAFYITANNTNTGSSFNPDISPTVSIASTTAVGDKTLITTATAHGLTSTDSVIIGYTNSVPVLHGIYAVEYNNATSFYIAQKTITNATSGGYTPLKDAVTFNNQRQYL